MNTRKNTKPTTENKSNIAPRTKTPLEWAAERGLVLEDGNPVPKMLEKIPIILRGKKDRRVGS